MIQSYNDAEKKFILTQASSIQRISQRIILSLDLSISNVKIHLRDLTQAYTQSATRLNRDVYVKPPEQWRKDNVIWKVILPL